MQTFALNWKYFMSSISTVCIYKCYAFFYIFTWYKCMLEGNLKIWILKCVMWVMGLTGSWCTQLLYEHLLKITHLKTWPVITLHATLTDFTEVWRNISISLSDSATSPYSECSRAWPPCRAPLCLCWPSPQQGSHYWTQPVECQQSPLNSQRRCIHSYITWIHRSSWGGAAETKTIKQICRYTMWSETLIWTYCMQTLCV